MRILGTVFPVQVTVRSYDEKCGNLLKKKSGDIIEGDSIDSALENAKTHVDGLLGSH
jgi:hypothetical protein